jgi:hypothetical protein
VGLAAKLKKCIFQEPQNQNVSPKAVAVLRTSCLLFMLYLLVAGAGCAFMRISNMAMSSFVYFVLYGYTLYCSYRDRIQAAVFMLNGISLVWIVMFYLLFGGGIGVRHFFYALVIADLVLVRKYPVAILMGLYVVRFLLYFNGLSRPAFYAESLPGSLQHFMYALSMVLECAMVLLTGIPFARDAIRMERRLQQTKAAADAVDEE